MSKKKKGEGWGENGFEDWGGYMAAKQAKLEEQFRTDACEEFKDAANIFQEIAIFVNGYTDPTADELRRLMMAYGGTYHHYLRPQATTHVIASNLPYSKIIMYRKSQNPIPVCKPQWILDSIKAGRVLNFQNYLLYSHHTDTQPQLIYKMKNKKTTNVDLDTNETRKGPKINVSRDDNDNRGEVVPNTVENQEISNLAAPPSSRDAHSSKNSEFISEFYSHSRLHHIATMGATFKEYVNGLRDKNNGKFPGLARLKDLKEKKISTAMSDSQSSLNNEMFDTEENRPETSQGSIIMHIDMDCFFVSVGIRDKPELKGLPVAVTHAKGNKKPVNNKKEGSNENANVDELGSLSEVASCSYDARKAGVSNGMFLGEALKFCPNLKTIPYDFEGYQEVSYTLYDTIASYTLDIEAVSCDEMYANCTKLLEESGLTPLEFATVIRQEIREKTGCPVSTGFGNNKLLARLATKKAKPDGQFHIRLENIEAIIGTFSVQDLPGVGWTTTNKLNVINVRTCTELQAVSLSTLQKEFGKKTGEVLYNMCRGIDHSKLNLEHIRKSVSAEVNYGIRFESNEDALDFLKKLSAEVCSRLKAANARGRCITLKLLVRAKEAPKETAKFMGHGLCDYMTKSKNLIAPIDDVEIVTKEVIALWNQMQKVPEDARGIGIQVTRLEIVKSKSRVMTLTSFVNKKKDSGMVPQSSETNKTNENQTSTNLNSKQLISQKRISIDQQNADVPDNINESILSELPEEIRHEILSAQEKRNPVAAAINKEESNTNVPKINKKKSEKQIQTHPENFFRQTKPGIPKSTKIEMPPIQEIDMSVLIELPEEIRNEILNEYSVKRNQDKVNVDTGNTANSSSSSNETTTTEKNRNEENISFSQVDPEFLAALSEDLRRDVQIYCKVKKAENCSKLTTDEMIRNNGASTSGQNVPKESKKVERNTKMKGANKSSKTSSKNNKKKGIQTAFKAVENKKESNEVSQKKNSNFVTKSLMSSTEKTGNADDKLTADEAEAILSHNRTITEDNESAIPHQYILINLVNRLLNLSLEQVKMQIQIWITNSKIVNEVDFLSLATFLSMLPEKKRIEDLHVLLKTMHRCMTKTGNCIWHRTYRKTVKYVQHYMQIEYNSNLMVPPIKCNLLQCNTNLV